MSNLALYRKFRPTTFEDVKGQDHIVTALKNQLRADKVGHAYLFVGTRGTGKTTVAKILARAVNCSSPTENGPCGQCEICKAIEAGTSLNVMEIDAASNNGVDNIRDIREETSYPPTTGKYKVFIIDEVHMLSTTAFNALLKTLEEPPAYVKFILATTEAHKIPATILSRCQRYDFKRISIDTIADRLEELLQKEGVAAEKKAIRYVAKAGDGSMRDALSLMDRCIAFYMDETITYDNVINLLGALDAEVFSRLLRMVMRSNVADCIRLLEEMLVSGKELTQFASDFCWYLRNLLLVKTSQRPEEAVDASSEQLRAMQEEAQIISVDVLIRYIRVLSELTGALRNSTQKRVLTEVALIKLCLPEMETDLGSVLDRVRKLEERMEEGVFVQKESPSPAEAPLLRQEKKKEETSRPLSSLPEDVQEAVKKWNLIKNSLENPLKVLLQDSIPRVGGEGEKLSLYIIVPNNTLCAGLHENEERQEQVSEAIAKVTGRQVKVRLCLPDRAPQNLDRIDSVDQCLKENIHMDILEEEEEDEEPRWEEQDEE